jgi:hypothetical protein
MRHRPEQVGPPRRPRAPVVDARDDRGVISLDARRIGVDFYFRGDDPASVSGTILTDVAPRPGLAGYSFEAVARAGRTC